MGASDTFASLDQPLPRRTSVTRRLIRAPLHILLGAGLFLLVETAASYPFISGWAALKTHGTAVEAVVTTLRAPGHAYVVGYHFAGPRSIAYDAFDQTDGEHYRRLAVGQRVTVYFDPQNPHVSMLGIGDSVHPTDFYAPITGNWKIALGMVAFFYAFFAIALVPSLLRDRYLLRWGRVAPATVVEERERLSRRNSKLAFLTYSFVDAAGQPIETTKTVAGDWRSKYLGQRGNLTVLYDPRDSENNILYPSARVGLTPKVAMFP